MKTTLFCALLLLVTAAAVPAQWAKQRDPRVPSLRDGKPNLSAPTPRAADGKPDLSGVWENVRDPLPKGVLAVEGPDFTVPRFFLDVTADMKPDRRDVGHLEIEVTVDDPKTYRKPIVWRQQATLMPDEDLIEYFCEENEKDVQHFQP